MAELPHSRALAHTETTDPRLEEMRQAEHDLVRWIVIGIVVAVPVCVVLFMAAIALAVSNASVREVGYGWTKPEACRQSVAALEDLEDVLVASTCRW